MIDDSWYNTISSFNFMFVWYIKKKSLSTRIFLKGTTLVNFKHDLIQLEQNAGLMYKCDHVSYDYEPKCRGHLRTKDGQLVRI